MGAKRPPPSRDGDSLAEVRALARFRALSAGGLCWIYLYMSQTARHLV